jgi:hypothetical protein
MTAERRGACGREWPAVWALASPGARVTDGLPLTTLLASGRADWRYRQQRLMGTPNGVPCALPSPMILTGATFQTCGFPQCPGLFERQLCHVGPPFGQIQPVDHRDDVPRDDADQRRSGLSCRRAVQPVERRGSLAKSRVHADEDTWGGVRVTVWRQVRL